MEVPDSTKVTMTHSVPLSSRMLGDSCVDLGQGFPNFDPPEFVVKAGNSEVISEDTISYWYSSCSLQVSIDSYNSLEVTPSSFAVWSSDA